MFELVKNVIADKETTWEFKRTLPTISFCLLPYDVGILMTLIFNATTIHIVLLIHIVPLKRYHPVIFFSWGVGYPRRHVPTLLRK